MTIKNTHLTQHVGYEGVRSNSSLCLSGMMASRIKEEEAAEKLESMSA